MAFPDLAFQPSGFSKTKALLEAVVADPDVTAVTVISWMPLQARHGDVEGPLDTFSPVAALTKGLRGLHRPRVVDGRLADRRRRLTAASS